MNFNTVNIADDKKLSLEGILKNPESLSWQPNDILWWLLDDAISSGNTDAMKTISSALKTQKETVTVDPEVSKQLAEEALKEEASNRAFIEKLETENQETKEVNEDKILELTAKLNNADEKIGSLEETVNKLLEAQKENREETSKNLEDILEAKKSGDLKSLNQFVAHLEELLTKKWMLKDDSKKETAKYPEEEIATLNTKRIKWRFINKKTIETVKTEDWSETVVRRPSLKINKTIRSRWKINKTIRKFNDIKDNPKEAVKYIMSKTNKRSWWMITASFKKLYNHLTIRDTGKFDEVFNKQKTKFIDDLFWNLEKKWMTDKDELTKKSIIKRIDYYQKAYKKTIITV